MSFSEEIKKIFIKGSNLSRLIYVNLAVFVVVNLVYAILYLFNGPAEVLIEWLSLPADFNVLIRRPWTIITYMFLHKSFLHILFNLIVLYWFGKIFLKYLSQRQLLSIYLLGGLSGGLFYIAAYNIFPVFEIDKYFAIALGASASVMAILVAIAALVPKQEIYLMFFGRVKIIYIALFTVIIDIISIPISNAGGHIAHLGGAVLGYLFAINYKKGNDFTLGFSKFLDKIFGLLKKDKNIRITYRSGKHKAKTKRGFESDMDYNKRKKQEQEEINRILDKVANSGYASLTPKEKETLFKMSNKK
ncbi:MAG TPA: rhomboid family intramembrane serine protease [Bacteroidales bacterium]|jgi:membrane associated rhomboid family serine protease|nr:rhomboid family intramembrane serine protease [Bacteroidales bacterium]MDD4235854.1 rhomboid family intramembrane serine protease [Bacteroidales bacterium]MDY0160758.1 rhomboid family intramembrane serine protease [Bacteroidales bacterium]HXK81965.1 rhomboid family intramembrane serine protease [Bacteroidales bacterium]